MTQYELTSEMTSLLTLIGQLASASNSLQPLQEGIVKAISGRLPYYNWVGFYMLDPSDPDTLVVGPFSGDPTPHVRIPVTQGLCGAAVASGITIVVDDVNADPRYLSCSLKTRSEIVVPIFVHGSVVGELDIDSHTPAVFTDADRLFLEKAACIVGRYMEDFAAPAPDVSRGEELA
jgi:L-methionine (R)-S-oxide reductase